ncbi:MAG: GNAT family N-acetyltransferase [Defluviitaleaceae bacterium]|nr:GNAT family N-acetyltransferase [Defluviitaleaceae bacterium]
MPDLLVKLYNMPKIEYEANMAAHGVKIKRAMALDKKQILEFVKSNFNPLWEHECERALFNSPSSCYIAEKDAKIIGFGCYDATALGFFGPTGVHPEAQGLGIGKALLARCLESMKEKGYGYAIIGYSTNATAFYEKIAGATIIEDSLPEQSVYSNMVGR